MKRAPSRVLLLSLRPTYSEAILNGSKHVELRRRPPRGDDARVALLYASSPVRALVGVCLVHGVVEEAPTALWARIGAQSGVSKAAFMNYFADLSIASALVLGQRWRFAKPIPLTAIRERWDGFQPPQSFRYLDARPSSDGMRVCFEDREPELVLPGTTLSHRLPRAAQVPPRRPRPGRVCVEFEAGAR